GRRWYWLGSGSPSATRTCGEPRSATPWRRQRTAKPKYGNAFGSTQRRMVVYGRGSSPGYGALERQFLVLFPERKTPREPPAGAARARSAGQAVLPAPVVGEARLSGVGGALGVREPGADLPGVLAN